MYIWFLLIFKCIYSKISASSEPDFDDRSHARWPEYRETEKWMYLRADTKNDRSTIERRKKDECELWRNAKDLEFANYCK